MLSGEATLTKLFSLPTRLFLGANSFLLEQTPFRKRHGMQENKQEVTKVVFIVINSGRVPSLSISLKFP